MWSQQDTQKQELDLSLAVYWISLHCTFHFPFRQTPPGWSTNDGKSVQQVKVYVRLIVEATAGSLGEINHFFFLESTQALAFNEHDIYHLRLIRLNISTVYHLPRLDPHNV